MLCDDAAQYVSVLCDGETIPSDAAKHIGACPDCKARLADYLAMGVEMRRTASLALGEAEPSRNWAEPQNRVVTLWEKGWGAMRIPRFAFAALVAGILILTSTLIVGRARAHTTGTVVLLTTVLPNGRTFDCPLSTQGKNQSCYTDDHVGSQFLAYKVRLLSREGSRVLLGIRTLHFPLASGQHNLSPFVNSYAPGKEVWFEPGDTLKFDVPDVGKLALTGVWMDHVPLLGKLDTDLNELRFSRPLLLKDGTVVGDFSSIFGGIFSGDFGNQAVAFYAPGEGRFLISLLPMEGAVEANVEFGQVSFKEGGHSWELVNGVPICRARHLWVVHQPNFTMKSKGRISGRVDVETIRLTQSELGVWVPQASQKSQFSVMNGTAQ